MALDRGMNAFIFEGPGQGEIVNLTDRRAGLWAEHETGVVPTFDGLDVAATITAMTVPRRTTCSGSFMARPPRRRVPAGRRRIYVPGPAIGSHGFPLSHSANTRAGPGRC